MSNQEQGNFIGSADENSQGEIAVQVEQEEEEVDDSNIIIEYHQSDPLPAAAAAAPADGEDAQEQEGNNAGDSFPVINNEPFLNEETLNGIYGLLRLNTPDMFDEVNMRGDAWKEAIDGILKQKLDSIHKKLEILSSIYQENIPTNQMHHIEKIMSIFKSKQKEIYISKIPKTQQNAQCNCGHSSEAHHGHAHHHHNQIPDSTNTNGTTQQHNQVVEESNSQKQVKQQQQQEEAECEIEEYKPTVDSRENDSEQAANEQGNNVQGEETTTATGVDSEDIDEEEAELRRLKTKLSENEKIREEQEEQRRVLIAQNMKLKAEYSEMLEKNRRLREDFNNRVSLENTILRREVHAVHGNGIDLLNEQSGDSHEGSSMQQSQNEVTSSSTTTATAAATSTTTSMEQQQQNSRMETGVPAAGAGAGLRANMVGISMHDVQSILSMEFVDLKKCRQMDPVDNSITFDLNENYSIRIKSCEEVKYDRSSMCANVPHFIFKDHVFPFLSSVELFRIRGVSPEWREMVRDVWHKTFKRDMQEQLLATDLCKEIEAQCCLMHIRNPFYQKLNVLLMAMVEVINWEELELKAAQNQLSFKEKKVIVALTRVIGAPTSQAMLPFAEYDHINQIQESDFGAGFSMEVVMKLQEMLYAAMQGQNLSSKELKKIYTNFLMSADVSASSMANDADKNVIILILITKQFFLFALLKNFFTCSSAFLHSAKAKLDSLSKDWPTSKGFLEGAYRILLLRNVTIKKVPGKQGQIVMKEEGKKKRKAGTTGSKQSQPKKGQDDSDVEDLKEKEDVSNEQQQEQGGRTPNQGEEENNNGEEQIEEGDEEADEDDDDEDDEEEEDEEQSENDVARLMKSIFNINKEVSDEPDIVIKRKSATLKVFLDQGTKLDIILNTVISLGMQNMNVPQSQQHQSQTMQMQQQSQHRLEQPKMSSSQNQPNMLDESGEKKSQGSSQIEELEVKFEQNKEHIESMKQASKKIQDSLMEQKNRLEAIEKRCKEQLAQFRTYDSKTGASIQ